MNVQIFSVDGKPIRSLEKEFSRSTFMDLKDIPSGIYFLELTEGDKKYRHRFIKL